MSRKILILGCGNMGKALLANVIQSGVLAKNIIVIEPSYTVQDDFNVRVLKDFDQTEIMHFNPDIIVFAVKPQVIGSLLHDYKQFSGSALFVSIIAGKTISFYEKHLGNNAAVVRAMPNLPLSIQNGMTVICNNVNVEQHEQSAVLKEIFGAKENSYIILEDESVLDLVTAISGSGPAYVFLFIESLIQAGIEFGLPEEVATFLVMKTVEGSVNLAKKSNCPVKKLRESVTSPAGTTEAALKVLMNKKVNSNGSSMPQLLIDAIFAARERSKELSE